MPTAKHNEKMTFRQMISAYKASESIEDKAQFLEVLANKIPGNPKLAEAMLFPITMDTIQDNSNNSPRIRAAGFKVLSATYIEVPQVVEQQRYTEVYNKLLSIIPPMWRRIESKLSMIEFVARCVASEQDELVRTEARATLNIMLRSKQPPSPTQPAAPEKPTASPLTPAIAALRKFGTRKPITLPQPSRNTQHKTPYSKPQGTSHL